MFMLEVRAGLAVIFASSLLLVVSYVALRVTHLSNIASQSTFYECRCDSVRILMLLHDFSAKCRPF